MQNALTAPQQSPEFLPSGLKIEGAYENKRNKDNAQLCRDIIREVYGADQCIVAHHITYVAQTVIDGYTQEVVEEIPALDTLIFDHDVAKVIWGKGWKAVLAKLATTPQPERDQLMTKLFYGRGKPKAVPAWKTNQPLTVDS